MNTTNTNTNTLQSMGSRVATVRRSLGWSQAELATRAGVSRQTIVRLEGAKVDPLRGPRAIADALGIPLADLLDGPELEQAEVDRLALAADLRELAARAGRLRLV